MKNLLKKINKKTASPPGTLIHVGEQKTDQIEISIIQYNESEISKFSVNHVEEIKGLNKFKGITWINVSGLHDLEVIKSINDSYGIDPMVQEDVLNTLQRPKIEDLGEYLFLVVKMLMYEKDEKRISSDQISFIMLDNTLITFEEFPSNVFNPVIKRIQNGKGRIRKRGVDYLLYALVDAVVDNCFLILEYVSENIEEIEDCMDDNSGMEILKKIQNLRKDLILFRKSVWPLREILNSFLKDESGSIDDSSLIYFRDIYDHTIQIIETSEAFRDVVAGLQDMYMSSMSNRMNEVMKILTMIATIFIPITFIAGIYGMNFEFFPELKWKYAYFGVLGIMVIVVIAMLAFFKKRKWF